MTLTAVVVVALAAVALAWRYGRWPCPAWLVPLLENPYVEAVAGARTLLVRADVREGMRVLDAGCGPGRLTLPAAEIVGPAGHVLAVDVQPAMLQRLERRLAARHVRNVEVLLAGLGDRRLPVERFDVALLVTVLGEIRDRPGALAEIRDALRVGGILSVTEVLPDPHYVPLDRVRTLAARVGFREASVHRGLTAFTINFVKVPSPGNGDGPQKLLGPGGG